MRGRTGNLIGKKLTSTDLYKGIWELGEQINERRLDNWIDATRLLVVKKSYTASTTTATFDFNADLGGGSVTFTGHDTYSSSSTWGPQQLHDNTRSGYDWCNAGGVPSLFGQWIFPKLVTVQTIFLVPRSSGDNFPSSVTVKADTNTVATASATVTLTAGTSGHQINYSGTGHKITVNTAGTTWKLEFGGSNAYIGEIEFWGYI